MSEQNVHLSPLNRKSWQERVAKARKAKDWQRLPGEQTTLAVDAYLGWLEAELAGAQAILREQQQGTQVLAKPRRATTGPTGCSTT